MILLLLTLQRIPGVALTGAFQSPRVTESSGIAVSRAHPGVLWTHNDSGDDAYVYATDLADTGDNDRSRKSVMIYAVPEPDPPGNAADRVARGHDRHRLAGADGKMPRLTSRGVSQKCP